MLEADLAECERSRAGAAASDVKQLEAAVSEVRHEYEQLFVVYRDHLRQYFATQSTTEQGIKERESACVRACVRVCVCVCVPAQSRS